MNKKNATRVNSVRFPDLQFYRFYGYRLELPADRELLEIQILGRRYRAITPQGPIDIRACPRCKRLLQLTDFYDDTSSCKVCHRILAKRWTKNHPELAKKYAKKYGKKYRYQKKLIDAGLK